MTCTPTFSISVPSVSWGGSTYYFLHFNPKADQGTYYRYTYSGGGGWSISYREYPAPAGWHWDYSGGWIEDIAGSPVPTHTVDPTQICVDGTTSYSYYGFGYTSIPSTANYYVSYGSGNIRYYNLSFGWLPDGHTFDCNCCGCTTSSTTNSTTTSNTTTTTNTTDTSTTGTTTTASTTTRTTSTTTCEASVLNLNIYKDGTLVEIKTFSLPANAPFSWSADYSKVEYSQASFSCDIGKISATSTSFHASISVTPPCTKTTYDCDLFLQSCTKKITRNIYKNGVMTSSSTGYFQKGAQYTLALSFAEASGYTSVASTHGTVSHINGSWFVNYSFLVADCSPLVIDVTTTLVTTTTTTGPSTTSTTNTTTTGPSTTSTTKTTTTGTSTTSTTKTTTTTGSTTQTSTTLCTYPITTDVTTIDCNGTFVSRTSTTQDWPIHTPYTATYRYCKPAYQNVTADGFASVSGPDISGCWTVTVNIPNNDYCGNGVSVPIVLQLPCITTTKTTVSKTTTTNTTTTGTGTSTTTNTTSTVCKPYDIVIYTGTQCVDDTISAMSYQSQIGKKSIVLLHFANGR